MLDLNEQPRIPKYELKLDDGTVKSYDPVLLSYELRVLDGEKDPGKIRETVNKVFEIDIDTFEAMLIIKDITEFSAKHLEGPLKKVFGEELFSAISTGSPPENSANLPQQSISV